MLGMGECAYVSHTFFYHNFAICFVAAVIYCYADYYIKLSSTAPAIEGVNVTFYADLFQTNGVRPQNETYSWVSEF